MKKSATKKLVLRDETVRVLGDVVLSEVKGAVVVGKSGPRGAYLNTCDCPTCDTGLVMMFY